MLENHTEAAEEQSFNALGGFASRLWQARQGYRPASHRPEPAEKAARLQKKILLKINKLEQAKLE